MLPAFQDARLALRLALELRPKTRGAPPNVAASVCGDLRVGTEDNRQGSMGLGVVAIGKAEDPVQEGPMPVTKTVQHA